MHCEMASTIDSLGDDELIHILRKVSEDSGSFQHSLVCSRWWRLNKEAQASLRILKGGDSLPCSSPSPFLSPPPSSSAASPASNSSSQNTGTVSQELLLRTVASFRRITKLELSPDAVSGGVDDHFLDRLSASLPMLERFVLFKGDKSQCHYTTEGLRALFSNCPQLKSLALHGHRAHPYFIPAELGQLTALEDLQLFAEAKGGTAMPLGFWGVVSMADNLAPLQTLTSLCIGGYCLRRLPSSITALSALKELALCSPNLERLPEDIGDLQRLEKLSVFSRELTFLPRTFWRLRQLRVLDLRCPMLHLTQSDIRQMLELQRQMGQNNSTAR